MKPYDHKKIEKKWQRAWEKNKLYATKDSGKKKFYVLDMFPYPSGEGLHVGHPKGYIATDIISRFKRMNGYSTLHPMGWDAFGLPAENYAIKNKIHPEKAVKENIKRFKKQLSIIGLDYDWSREINTTDPEYYKWTQWIFLQMYKKGLAFQSHEPINWCPSCQTGLANEDLEDGRCERCGSVVEKRPIRQWVLRITDYADRLLNDLETLNWPNHIKEAQRNWIGRSEGAEFDFKIKGTEEKITVFTTRADTLFGVTYVVLAPEHPLVAKLSSKAANAAEIKKYTEAAKGKTEIERTAEGKEKTGVEIRGVKAINPANNEELPVWVADYVLGQYGTGAVMAVPAHDDRDYAFAKKYDLPIREVIQPLERQTKGDDAVRPELPFKERNAIVAIIKHWSEDKYLCLQWKKVDWKGFVIGGIEAGEQLEETGKREILEETGYKNARFVKKIDGIVHAQFYHVLKKENRWAHFQGLYYELENGDRKEISEEEKAIHDIHWFTPKEVEGFLNVPDMKIIWNRYQGKVRAYTNDGILVNSESYSGMESADAQNSIAESYGKKKVTYKLRDWVFSRQRYWGEPIPLVHCPTCGVVPVPEKELPVKLPKVKSYEPTGTGESPLAEIASWVNTNCPNCKGPAKRETNTMPQWAGSCWYYLRYLDPKNKKALVDNKKEKYWMPVDLYVGGAEHATRHLIYARFWHKFLYDISVASTEEPFAQLESVGLILAEDGRKMSKRWGNVVNPDDVVAAYGADTMRLYEMFMGPFTQAISWNTASMIGSRRFLERVWKLSEKVDAKAKPEKGSSLDSLMHYTIQKVTEDIGSMKYNTAISQMMILMNEFDKTQAISKIQYEQLLKLLAPFAPHITEELWSLLGHTQSIHVEKWPIFDADRIITKEYTIAVQVNGKVRAEMQISAEMEEDEVKTKALQLPEVLKWVEGKEVRRVIVVKGRLVNIVV